MRVFNWVKSLNRVSAFFNLIRTPIHSGRKNQSIPSNNVFEITSKKGIRGGQCGNKRGEGHASRKVRGSLVGHAERPAFE